MNWLDDADDEVDNEKMVGELLHQWTDSVKQKKLRSQETKEEIFYQETILSHNHNVLTFLHPYSKSMVGVKLKQLSDIQSISLDTVNVMAL